VKAERLKLTANSPLTTHHSTTPFAVRVRNGANGGEH